MKTIYFDMDGTIANLYGVENWLDDLLTENTFPYENAEPMFNAEILNKILENLQASG